MAAVLFAKDAPKYPKREPFFVLKFQRLLDKSGAAHEITTDGCWLLNQIVRMEDATRYRRGVHWTNESLCDRFAWSNGKLQRIRERCVRTGWLHYEAGAKGRPGLYWVTIPAWAQLDDSHQDGDELSARREIGVQNRPESGKESGRQTERNPDDKRSTYLPNPKDLSPTPSERGAVVELLKDSGIAKYEETIDEALSNGLGLDQIHAVVSYWSSRPHAWGPGALRVRLTSRSAPGLEPGQGWPPPSPKEAKANRDNVHAAERRRLAESDARRPERKDAERLELTQLELQFGEQVDALPAVEQIDLLPMFAKQFRERFDSQSPTYRPLLLRAFAAKAMEN